MRTKMRLFIISHPVAYWLAVILTLGHVHTYQLGWEAGMDHIDTL